MNPRRNPRLATAAVEFLVLLPVMVLMLFGMMYVGELTVFKERTHFGGQYAMDAKGNQSESQSVRGTITDLLYSNLVGKLAVSERAATSAQIPEPGEIPDMFEEMCRPVNAVRATGRYVFTGGKLKFVVTTRESDELSPEGKYINRYALREDNIPELTTEMLQGWAERNRVDLAYDYEPYYISIGKWPLEAVGLATGFQSAVRAGKTREVTDPPSGMSHTIETVTANPQMSDAGQLPDYPDFGGDEQFWEPN